jgi:nifR3 family TIM-barrel protein
VDLTPRTAPALRIGPVEVSPPVVLAPMAGVTNAPFRRLCRRFGGGLYVSEMVMARAYLEGNERTARMVSFGPDERPRSLQLYGVDPADVGDAVARLTAEGGVDHIDLNFGCPAAKVTRKGGGAAIPARPALLAAIVRAAVRAAAPAAVPVTVKFRLGLDRSLPTALTTGRVAEQEGAAAVALHARTAEQHYAGAADWAAIAALKEHVRSIPVLGNGDVFEGGDGPRMLAETGCDGVVVGRGCLGRPWLFRDLALAFAGRPVPGPPPLGEVVAVLAEHAGLLVDWFGEARGCREVRKHTGWYLKGYPVGPAIRRALASVSSLDEVHSLLDPLPAALPADPGAGRMVRGHTSGPRRVVLPAGWLDRPDDATPPAGADLVVSGG